MQLAMPNRRIVWPAPVRGALGAFRMLTSSWSGVVGTIGVLALGGASLIGPLVVPSPYVSDWRSRPDTGRFVVKNPTGAAGMRGRYA